MLTYSVSIFIVLVVVCIVYYSTNINFIYENINTTYSQLNKGLVRELDHIYDQMDFMILNLLSDKSIKSDIKTLSVINNQNDKSFSEIVANFSSELQTYSILKSYHSIIFMTSKGDFFSSNFIYHDFFKIPKSQFNEFPWIKEIEQQYNSTFIIHPYTDPWSKKTIFGFGRQIQSFNNVSSFLVAQKDITALEMLFSMQEDKNINFIVFNKNKDIFYNSPELSEDELEYHRKNRAYRMKFVHNPITGLYEQYFSSISDNTGLEILIIVNRDILISSIRHTSLLIIIGISIILLISFLYNYLSSRVLTKPLNKITDIMNKTNLNQIPDPLEIENTHDEISDLITAFYELIKRLNSAKEKEIHYTTAWLQARFDALQEQINPHFIFNSLTVIARRGFELGDDDICETCDSIAAMLRYSSSTVERSATIEEETEHVGNYLLLMKKRLGKRLDFSISVDPDLKKHPIPKIILQQLVENSIEHGFRNIKRNIVIKIDIYKRNNFWKIEVTDNGEGFNSQILTEIKEQLEVIQCDIQDGHIREGLEIGGMGLANTFLRLFIFYNQKLQWDINNSPGNGCCISFSGPIYQEKTGENQYV